MTDKAKEMPTGLVRKTWIERKYNYNRNQLSYILNHELFEGLKALNYKKKNHSLTPQQFKYFVDNIGLWYP